MVKVDKYLNHLGSSLQQIPLEQVQQVIQILHQARLNGNQVFVMGNGGSASTSSHFVCDLAKNTYFEGLPAFRAIDLNSSNAIFTALANDEGYENVFSQQLRNLVNPNDVVIGISTSGNSPNILKAIDLANKAGALTIGMTGYEGGKLANLVNVEVRVPSDNIRHIEDIHMIISHLISFALYELSSETIAFKIKKDDSIKPQELPVIAGNFTVNEEELSLMSSEVSNYESNEIDKKHSSMLFQLLNMMLGLTKTESGTLIMLDDAGNVIDGVQVYRGKSVSPSIEQMDDISKNGLAGWVVKNQQSALIENTNDDDRWLQRPWENMQDDLKSALSVPIKAGKIVGCITLVRPNDNRFSIKDLELVTNMTSSIAPALFSPAEKENN